MSLSQSQLFLIESYHSFLIHLFATVRRSMQNSLKRKSDQITGQAAAAEDAVDDPLDDTALGLDVWVQGINPIVEYVLLIIFFVSSPASTAFVFVNSS